MKIPRIRGSNLFRSIVENGEYAHIANAKYICLILCHLVTSSALVISAHDRNNFLAYFISAMHVASLITIERFFFFLSMLVIII